MSRSAVTVLVWSVLAVAVGACGPDDRDLSVAAKTYFSRSTTPIQAYRLLAASSRPHTTVPRFTEARRGLWELDGVTVLGEERRGETTYGKVMRWVRHPSENCREALTSTWIREQGRWRVLQFPELSEQVRMAYAAGDHDTVLSLVDDWLALNPLSVTAHLWRLDARSRSAHASALDPRATSELVAALLAINPRDDYALCLAISHTATLDAARAHFDALPTDSCLRDEAAFRLVERLSDAQAKLAFLDESKEHAPALTAARIDALHAAGRGAEALSLLRREGDAIRKDWTRIQPLYGPDWAVRLGVVAAMNGDPVEARSWRELAVSLLPRGVDTSRLDHAIEDAARRGG